MGSLAGVGRQIRAIPGRKQPGLGEREASTDAARHFTKVGDQAIGHGSQATLMARLVRDAGVPKIAA
jgi:hypothetical protein